MDQGVSPVLGRDGHARGVRACCYADALARQHPIVRLRRPRVRDEGRDTAPASRNGSRADSPGYTSAWRAATGTRIGPIGPGGGGCCGCGSTSFAGPMSGGCSGAFGGRSSGRALSACSRRTCAAYWRGVLQVRRIGLVELSGPPKKDVPHRQVRARQECPSLPSLRNEPGRLRRGRRMCVEAADDRGVFGVVVNCRESSGR